MRSCRAPREPCGTRRASRARLTRLACARPITPSAVLGPLGAPACGKLPAPPAAAPARGIARRRRGSWNTRPVAVEAALRYATSVPRRRPPSQTGGDPAAPGKPGVALRAVTISGSGWNLSGQRPAVLASKEAGCASPSADRSGASGAPGTPAPRTPAAVAALRVAALLAPTPRALRSAPSSCTLHARDAKTGVGRAQSARPVR